MKLTKLKERLRRFFMDDGYEDDKVLTLMQAYKRLLKAHKEDLKKVIDVEGGDAYLISEHLREGCTSCPFCFGRDLNFGMIDESPISILKQDATCLDCGKTWTVEYEASRVSYKNKWYSRYEHWPTFLQTNSPDYKRMQRIKYGLE